MLAYVMQIIVTIMFVGFMLIVTSLILSVIIGGIIAAILSVIDDHKAK